MAVYVLWVVYVFGVLNRSIVAEIVFSFLGEDFTDNAKELDSIQLEHIARNQCRQPSIRGRGQLNRLLTTIP